MRNISREKDTKVKWGGLKLTVHYEENGFPDVIIKDIYCEDDPIKFLETVQEGGDIIGDVATLVAEERVELNTDDFDDRSDYLYEALYDK